jgi:hypothetical protein
MYEFLDEMCMLRNVNLIIGASLKLYIFLAEN